MHFNHQHGRDILDEVRQEIKSHSGCRLGAEAPAREVDAPATISDSPVQDGRLKDIPELGLPVLRTIITAVASYRVIDC